ncbi:MAG: prepilin peptidase [Gemmatimonadetes bacterium]|nr:prepilin peptidase [Gemmatimonadota bacterium]
MPEIWGLVLAALLGLAVGSFLNVCVMRWPEDESVLSPPSRCPRCQARIAWYDNVPILSYLLLQRRCRACREPISMQYPLVEAATALLWAAAAVRHGVELEALRTAVFLSVLFGIALTDARFYIIPNQFSVGGLALGLAFAPAPGGITALQAVAGAALGFALLWAVARLGKLAFRKEAMGLGDVKMMAMVGAFVGPAGVLLTVFLGALLGAFIFGPISLKTGKLVPFGIFLAVGAALVQGWGDVLLAWYATTILGRPG